jgi:hypothetical protein
MHNPVQVRFWWGALTQIWDCYEGGTAQTWGFTGTNGPPPPWQP